MNKIFLIIVMFCAVMINAQTNVINITETAGNNYSWYDGTAYLKDIDNIGTPYAGVWKWTEGTKEFILTLIPQIKYHYHENGKNYYKDRLVGYYVYKENGQVIADSSIFNNDANWGINGDYPKINLTADKDASDLNCLTGFIEDYPKRRDYDAEIKPVLTTPKATPQISLTMRDGEYIVYKQIDDNGNVAATLGWHPVPGNTFPLQMTLTKQP